MPQRQRKPAASSANPAKAKADSPDSPRISELEARVSELNALRDDFDALRRAHDAQSRHLITERLLAAENVGALLSEIEELKADVEWRKGVMKVYEEQLETLRNSRSMRYTSGIRRVGAVLRSWRS